MLTILTFAVLAQQPAVPKLAMSSFVCSEEIAPGLCEAYERRFTSELTRTRELAVTTERDVQQLLGLERQKQLLGCAEDSMSCAAELAGALGVDGLVSGAVTRTPTGYLLNIKVTKAKDGSEWASASEILTSEGQLLDKLDPIAARFVRELNGKTGGSSAGRIVMFSAAGVGLALTVSGAVLFNMAKSEAALLRSDTVQSPLELQATASRGNTYQTAGVLLMTVGIPTFTTFLILALVNPGGDTRTAMVAPVFFPGGAGVAFVGALP